MRTAVQIALAGLITGMVGLMYMAAVPPSIPAAVGLGAVVMLTATLVILAAYV